MDRQTLPGVAWACALLIAAAGAAAQAASPVSIVTPQRLDVQEARRLTGTVTAARVSSLSARIDGVVAEVTVDAGDAVAAGDVILRLDDELARLERARALASVSEGRARLEESRRVSRETAELAASRNLPQTQAEAAKADARIGVETLSRLEAEAALQEARLRRHALPAPFAGVIAARYVDPGEWVQPSGAVVDLVALDALRFDVQAPQELYPLLETGAAASVALDAIPGTVLSGRIGALVPVADSGTRNFLLRIAFDVPPPGVIPGMSGQARIALGTATQAWSLPRDAVVSYPDGTRSVWVVAKRAQEELAVARRVRLGRALDGRVEILDGLDGSERVVVRGNESLRDEQPVRIVPGPQE